MNTDIAIALATVMPGDDGIEICGNSSRSIVME
jgi:hypothetical protein